LFPSSIYLGKFSFLFELLLFFSTWLRDAEGRQSPLAGTQHWFCLGLPCLQHRPELWPWAGHAKRIAGPRCRFVDPAEGDLKCKGMKYLDFL